MSPARAYKKSPASRRDTALIQIGIVDHFAVTIIFSSLVLSNRYQAIIT